MFGSAKWIWCDDRSEKNTRCNFFKSVYIDAVPAVSLVYTAIAILCATEMMHIILHTGKILHTSMAGATLPMMPV